MGSNYHMAGLVDHEEFGVKLQQLDRKMWQTDRIDRLFTVLDTKAVKEIIGNLWFFLVFFHIFWFFIH